MPAINVAKTKFEHADPILSVSDMAASVKYYVEALGFRNAEKPPGSGLQFCDSYENQKNSSKRFCHWSRSSLGIAELQA